MDTLGVIVPCCAEVLMEKLLLVLADMYSMPVTFATYQLPPFVRLRMPYFKVPSLTVA
jgi:hypothetical protein